LSINSRTAECLVALGRADEARTEMTDLLKMKTPYRKLR